MKNLGIILGLLVFGVISDFGFDAYIQLIMIYILINTVLALSLNLVNGHTGQFSLGHAGFMAVGAYSTAFLASKTSVPEGFLQIPSMLALILMGGAFAAVAGYCVGLPSLRLKGDYLAIVTLGFSEIVRVIFLNTQAVGGARGFYGIPGPSDIDLGGFVVSKFLITYTIALLFVVLCFYFFWQLLASRHGRSFLSVREDEIAAESMGVNTTQAKVRAFVISSFFAGVAGGLFALYTNYLNPSSFAFSRSIDAVIMVVLGGMGSLSGSVLAAICITVLPELLRSLQSITGVDLRMVIYSLALILLMILRPQGLFGKLELPDVIRKLKSYRKGSSI